MTLNNMLEQNKNIIEIQNASFSYGDEKILENINLNIQKGDYLGIIGPNGGGKTTLIKILLGLLPLSGKIKLFGKDLNDFKDWPRIGYISQKAAQIDPNFPITVDGVVSMGIYAKRGLFHFPNRHDKEKVDLALKEVEMENYRNRLIGDLSGGQQQRVFIARALVGDPEVLVLDEPTVGVDIKTQEQFYRLLKNFNEKYHLTLILISHDLDVIKKETDKLIYINRSVIYQGSPKEFSESQFFTHHRKILHPFHH